MKLGGVDVTDLRAQMPQHAWRRYNARATSNIMEIAIHHSVTSSFTTASQIAWMHINPTPGVPGSDWPGIGYHLLVTRDGDVQYVGDIGTTRYHVGDQNWRTVGVCMIGDFSLTPPPEAQLRGCARAVQALRGELGWDLPVKKHRDYAATACPGNTVTQWWPQLLEYIEEDDVNPEAKALVDRMAALGVTDWAQYKSFVEHLYNLVQVNNPKGYVDGLQGANSHLQSELRKVAGIVEPYK